MILSIFFEDIIKLWVKRFDPEQTSNRIYVSIKYANGNRNVFLRRNSWKRDRM